MAGDWNDMITDEQNRLQRGRQLARMTKPELISRVLDLEQQVRALRQGRSIPPAVSHG